MAGPLDGIRVLDLTRIVSGPIGGRMLADLGAEVIKIESPDGDLTRPLPPLIDGMSPLHAHLNAGKRNVCVDIRSPDGAELVARLAEVSDVLLENFRPRALAGRGLSYADLRPRNPRLVYCSITGFGQDGPWVDRRAHAPLLHAEGGMIEVASRLRARPPVPEVHQHADLYSGFFAVSAVLAALFERQRTGAGQQLDIAMAEVMLYASDQIANDLTGSPEQRAFDTWTYPMFTLASGDQVCFVGNPEHLFAEWMEAFGGADAVDPSPVDHVEARDRLAPFVERLATLDEVLERLEDRAGTAARVGRATDLARTDWADHRALLGEVWPGIDVPAAPWRSSTTDIGPAGSAAPLGAHGRDVLATVLGLRPDEIEGLVATGAIRLP